MSTRSDQHLPLGKLIAGAAVGALAMYLLDPERGASRRAAAVGKLNQAGRQATQAVSGAIQDLSHRAGTADVFHPTDIDSHLDRLGPAASARASMTQVFDKLFSRPAGDIETIARDLRERTGINPARNAALLSAATVGLLGLLRNRSPLALVAGLAGAVLLARRARSQPFAGLAARARDQATVDIEKTIRIDAAPERVYDLWANVESFPRFMANVAEVRDLGADLSHWVVKGPAGTSYEWNSIMTEQSRPHRLAWRSVPGGDVQHSGEVRLEPVHGGTRATVRLRYTPPAGSAGQAVATLLGSNPRAQLDDDLQRMKNLLEKGSLVHAAGDAGTAHGKFLH